MPDGSLHWPDGRVVAVEVEITRKHREDYGPIVRTYAEGVTEVWWYCPPGLVDWAGRRRPCGAQAPYCRGSWGPRRTRPSTDRIG